MNKELLKLAHISNKGVSKKIIFIIIVCLIMLLTFVPYTIYLFYNNYSTSVNNSNPNMRIIQIEPEYKNKLDSLNLKNHKNVVRIYDDYNVKNSNVYIYELSDSENVQFNISFENFEPNIIKGRKIQNDNEIVCASKLSMKDPLITAYDEWIDMSEYLNKTITVTMYDSYTNENEVIRHDYDFKIVGLYDSLKSLKDDHNSCYVTEKTAIKLYNENKPGLFDELHKPIGIFVDKYKNLENVTTILEDNDIPYFIEYLDTEFILKLDSISKVFAIATIIISLIILLLYLNSYLSSKKKNLCLYKALGYNKKQISFIIFYGLFEMILTSALIVLGLFFIAYWLYFIFGIQNPLYTVAEFEMPYIEMLIYIFIIMIITYLMNKNMVNKYIKIDIKDIKL